ncbi:hypothetical protein Taro_030931 [Colocasia esculenta]|uniref:Uncharacterized protein n=1 Tax=Colocasia esculenta TaxID=4460 RepID=A0A843W4V1_COLES|nr:hypothetical protein [Colocasia esculenta]
MFAKYFTKVGFCDRWKRRHAASFLLLPSYSTATQTAGRRWRLWLATAAAHQGGSGKPTTAGASTGGGGGWRRCKRWRLRPAKAVAHRPVATPLGASSGGCRAPSPHGGGVAEQRRSVGWRRRWSPLLLRFFFLPRWPDRGGDWGRCRPQRQ